MILNLVFGFEINRVNELETLETSGIYHIVNEKQKKLIINLLFLIYLYFLNLKPSTF